MSEADRQVYQEHRRCRGKAERRSCPSDPAALSRTTYRKVSCALVGAAFQKSSACGARHFFRATMLPERQMAHPAKREFAEGLSHRNRGRQQPLEPRPGPAPHRQAKRRRGVQRYRGLLRRAGAFRRCTSMPFPPRTGSARCEEVNAILAVRRIPAEALTTRTATSASGSWATARCWMKSCSS